MSLREGLRFLRYVRRSLRQPPGNFAPPVAVIIPCKGWDPDFEVNLSRFLSQDYPRFQLVFVVASDRDPAYSVLRARLKETRAGEGVKTLLVVAGTSEIRGEKVNNLIRGLAAVDPDAQVLAFADIDAQPRRDWLRSLVAPLAEPSVTVSSGFRWYLPGASFVSQLLAAWDTSIATYLGDHAHNFAWGGSMAIRAADFERLRVAERYWDRTVSDDYGMTRAVRDARGYVHFEPRCLLASRENPSLREFLRWANRQIIITRVYAPHLWLLGLAAHGFFCATFLFGLVPLFLPGFTPLERSVTAAILLAGLLLGMAKGRIRSIVARELFPEERETLSHYGGRYWQLAPLVPWTMLVNFVTAGFTRRIEWRGIHYDLPSAHEVRVLQRDDPSH